MKNEHDIDFNNEELRFFIDDFGAKGDGKNLDDDAVLQAVLAARKVGGRVVFGSKGSEQRNYRLQREVDLYFNDGIGPLNGNSVTVEFVGSMFSTIIHFEPQKKFSVLFRYGNNARFIGDICIKRFKDETETDYKGVVFATHKNKQVKLVADTIWISGKFMFGKFHRFTLIEKIGRFESRHAKCHIAYANCDLSQLVEAEEAGESNFFTLLKTPPSPKDSWNGQPPAGWFHNAIDYGQLYCKEGEIGLFGSPVNISISQLTTEGQILSDRSLNEILPTTEGGTGCYLFGYAHSRLRAGIAIVCWYLELTERPLVIEYADGIDINTMYAMGFWDNSTIVNKDNAHSCINSNGGGLVNIGLLRTDGLFNSIVDGSNRTKIKIISLRTAEATWIPNKKVILSKNQIKEEEANCTIGEWSCPRILYSSDKKINTVTMSPLTEIDISQDYHVNISGMISDKWITGPTIVRVSNGVIKSVVGDYDTFIKEEGFSLAILPANPAVPSTRLGSLVVVRDSPFNSASMSIAITQVNEILSKVSPRER
ncbi:hypothetical protein ACXV6R_002050 [Yersinia enterocolitica]|nr:hypothetical protein [Yersinia enterocolitica]